MKSGPKNILLVVVGVLVGVGLMAGLKGFTASGAAKTSSPTAALSSSAMPAADMSVDPSVFLAPRAMGNPDAPVRIDEFASLSCSHCAQFYNEVFEKVKTAWIDTGKVYFVYHDFPLNAPALEAAMAARCLPETNYFPFIKTLFATQNDWAFNADYAKSIRDNARLAGLDDATYDACVKNDDFKSALIDTMKSAAAAHQIDSTPTFIINNSKKIRGAVPFAEFEAAVLPLLGEEPKTEEPKIEEKIEETTGASE